MPSEREREIERERVSVYHPNSSASRRFQLATGDGWATDVLYPLMVLLTGEHEQVRAAVPIYSSISIYIYIHRSIYISVYIHLFLCLYVHLSIYLSIYR